MNDFSRAPTERVAQAAAGRRAGPLFFQTNPLLPPMLPDTAEFR